MKLNIRIPSEGPEDEGSEGGIGPVVQDEALEEAPLRLGRLRLPGSVAQYGSAGEDISGEDLLNDFIEDEGEEEEDDLGDEAWPEDEFESGSFEGDVEEEGVEWEDFLSEDEEGVEETVAGGLETSWDNPLLDDDDEDFEELDPGSGVEGKGKIEVEGPLASARATEWSAESSTRGAEKGNSGRGSKSEGKAIDALNPLLDDEDDDGLVERKIVVPDKPSLSPRDSGALEERETRAAAARARKKHRGEVGSKDELDGQVGYAKKISYEVSVDDEGREREARKALKAGEKKERDEPGQTGGGKVEVLDGEGKARWTVRKDAGRLSSSQLGVFKNLNRAGGTEAAEELVREVFQRATDSAPDSAAEKRRKRLANRAIYGVEAVTANSRRRFTEKDREVLRFLGMFKYANAKHVARVQQVKEATMLKRLYSLAERNLVVKKDLYGAKPLWYLTEGGMICSGLEIPRVKESGITYSMLPHQFVVNHVAGNLWGAGVNVLGLEDFPERYRRDEMGNLVLGESLVSEYEVQSSFASAKAANHRADVYRPAILDAMNREFRRWSAEGKDPESSPEMLPGNEYMWTLFPPFSLKLAYHVPDLVVKRPRTDDGRPQSIAVEIELANKPLAAYERALNAYRFDKQIYGRVVWVVRSRGAARKIQEAAKKIGTWDEGRVGIVPIYTEEGVFKGKAVWTL